MHIKKSFHLIIIKCSHVFKYIHTFRKYIHTFNNKFIPGANSTEVRIITARDDQTSPVEENEERCAEDASTSPQEGSRPHVRADGGTGGSLSADPELEQGSRDTAQEQ